MIIEEDYGNEYYGNLIIENYPNLKKIVVKAKSLNNLKSLKICNCEKLKTIDIKNKVSYLYCYDGSFENVKSVIIDSICLFGFIISIFLNYNHS